MEHGQPTFTGALRLHVIPLEERLRLEYHANDPLNPNAVPTGEPVFFEEVLWEEDKRAWVSQLVVGDMATVHGSGFFIDADGKRHFRMMADPGRYAVVGQEIGG
jgi:hypothetical protein